MRVLVACEESQRVCTAFRKRGHLAFSCDILPCSGGRPEWHIQGDVRPYINGYCRFTTMNNDEHAIDSPWDLLIAHPPCTKLSKAGARWLYTRPNFVDPRRMAEVEEAADFFWLFLISNARHICVENPRPLKVAGLPPASQYIEPYMFGHPYSKCTGLWLTRLPLLCSTNVMADHSPYLPSNTSMYSRGKGGSHGVANTARQRSVTFCGIAEAMADQWGVL